MQSNYEKALHWVLQHDAGYVNHPQDPGGATNKGITQKTYDAYRRAKGVPVRDVRDIDDVEVRAIYREQYARPVWFDALPSGVDYALFDFAVNSGVSRAVKYIQRLVGTRQDGIMGNQTLSAIRAQDAAALINALCDARLAFMRGLKIWPTFGRGWQRRVDGMRKSALALASDAPVIPLDAVGEVATQKADGEQSLTGSIASSRRSKAAIAGGVGVALSAVPEAIELAQPAKEAFALGKYAPLIGSLITAAALAYIVYVRMRDVRD